MGLVGKRGDLALVDEFLELRALGLAVGGLTGERGLLRGNGVEGAQGEHLRLVAAVEKLAATLLRRLLQLLC